MTRTSFTVLQQRIDAVKRKCATATKADVDKAFRNLAKKHHPDVGGDREVFEKLGTMRASLNAFFRDAPPPKKKRRRTDATFADWLEVRLDALRGRCSPLNG